MYGESIDRSTAVEVDLEGHDRMKWGIKKRIKDREESKLKVVGGRSEKKKKNRRERSQECRPP